MTTKSWQMIIVLTALIAVGLSACDQGRQKPISIAINDWTGYQPLVLARQLGYLDDNLVHLATLGSTTESLQKFRAGIVDAATVTLDEALLLKAEGYDISIILIMDISNGADAVISKPNIHSLAQLKGKRIGVENTALGAYVLARALDMANLDISDIDTAPINASEQVAAFNNPEIDAVVSFEPAKSQLLTKGGRMVFDSTMIPDEIVDVLVVKHAVLEQDSNGLKQLIHAWFKTLDYIHNHRDDALHWLSQQQQIDLEATSKAMDEIIFPGQEKNRTLLKSNGPTQETLRKMSQIMLANKLIVKQPDIETLLNDRFVK